MEGRPQGPHALIREYRLARRPDRLTAPPAWYDEIVVIAAGTLLTALTPDVDGWRFAILVAWWPRPHGVR